MYLTDIIFEPRHEDCDADAFVDLILTKARAGKIVVPSKNGPAAQRRVRTMST
jgi:hypothetical protein